jgi:hypothetical protein
MWENPAKSSSEVLVALIVSLIVITAKGDNEEADNVPAGLLWTFGSNPRNNNASIIVREGYYSSNPYYL